MSVENEIFERIIFQIDESKTLQIKMRKKDWKEKIL